MVSKAITQRAWSDLPHSVPFPREETHYSSRSSRFSSSFHPTPHPEVLIGKKGLTTSWTALCKPYISLDLNFLTCEMGIRYLPGLMHWTVRKSIMVFWGYLRFRSEKQICSCVLCGEIFWSKGPWEECWDPYTVTSKGVCVSLSSSDLGHPSHFIDEKLKTQRAEADLLCQAIKVKGSANRRPLYIYANTDGFMGVLFQPLLGRKLSWVSNTLKSVLVWLQVSEF